MSIKIQGNVVIDDSTNITANSLVISNTTASTSNTTGALVVKGGVGVSGNVYAGALYSNGSLLVTSVTGTAPVVSSGGNTPAISMAAATTSVSGYLTSTDWNTFNGKSPAAGSSSITTTGTVTSGTWSASFGAVSGANLTSITGGNVTGTVANATAAVTFSSTTQNSQFNSLGVGTAGSTTSGEIRATNNITAYYSDERLKTKVGNIENALDKVKQIETMVYHANETAVGLGYDASIIEVGVTAQSVQRVMPQTVAPAPIDDKYLTVRYERLVPLLIEAIKELEAQVAELKAR